jgi:hypothetical protein
MDKVLHTWISLTAFILIGTILNESYSVSFIILFLIIHISILTKTYVNPTNCEA